MTLPLSSPQSHRSHQKRLSGMSVLQTTIDLAHYLLADTSPTTKKVNLYMVKLISRDVKWLLSTL